MAAINGFDNNSWFYILAALVDIIAVSFYPDARVFTKPLLMIVLVILFYRWTLGNIDFRRKIFLIALCFAWLGDVFLLSDSMFLFGLGAFLIMQILYSILFFIDQNYYGRREGIFGLLLALTISIVLFLLAPSLGNLLIAVGVYTGTIAVMSFSSYTRDFRYGGYWHVFVGTILFMISDSVLAINQFAEPIPLGGIIVMSTYLTAQYLISFGYASYLNENLA